MLELQSNEPFKAMTDAKYLYEHSKNMDNQRIYDFLVSLNEYQLFSIGQLAQLSGVSVSTIHNWRITAPAVGSGRFNPQSLDTLIQLRLNFINGRPLNMRLLSGAAEDGNSHRVIAKFTGLTPSQISRKLRNDVQRM